MAKENNKKQKTTKEKKVTKVKKEDNKKKEEVIKSEENGYGRTLLAAVLIVVIFLGGYLAVQYNKHKDDGDKPGYQMTDDERSFKEEYEKLNNTTKSDGTQNKEIKIIEDNNIVYTTLDEVNDILDSGSGVIYFGYAADAYSRSAVPVLLNAMSSTNLDKIYYVNIRPNDKEENDLRDIYNLNDKNKAKKTKDASDAYYEVVTSLADYLDEYVLYTSKGKKVKTGVKRLNTPTVVAVKNGEIVGFHEGTLDGHELDDKQNLRDLTDEEVDKLSEEYTKLIASYLGSECGVGEESGC